MQTKKVLLLLALTSSILFSNQIDSSINIIEKTNTKLENYQNKIEINDDKQNQLYSEYKYVNKEIKSTKNYNKQLEQILNSQKNELKDLKQQITDIEETQKNIYPLMKKMIASLKKLVDLDTPFLLNERKKRIEKLENVLPKADIKTAEKFRIILEAFKIEYDYSKNIETYQEITDNKTYNFLRIGRVALFKQSLDGKEYFSWSKKNKSWDFVESSTTKANIRKGIKIAKNQENVALLELPFSIDEEK